MQIFVLEYSAEEAYAPFLNEPMDPAALKAAAAHVPVALRTQLLKKVPNDVLNEGHFKLSMEMAAQAVSSYLENEADRCALENSVPLALEMVFTGALPGGAHVRGVCDRMEERNGLVHVLDLKTGTVRPEELQLKGLEREHLKATHRHALQLMIYALMAFQNDASLRHLRAGIVPLRRPTGSEGLWLSIAGSRTISRDMLADIEALLDRLVDELRDPAIPFRHDPASKWCSCCIP